MVPPLTWPPLGATRSILRASSRPAQAWRSVRAPPGDEALHGRFDEELRGALRGRHVSRRLDQRIELRLDRPDLRLASEMGADGGGGGLDLHHAHHGVVLDEYLGAQKLPGDVPVLVSDDRVRRVVVAEDLLDLLLGAR